MEPRRSPLLSCPQGRRVTHRRPPARHAHGGQMSAVKLTCTTRKALIVIRATVMMRRLPTLLIALFLTTSGAGSTCEIDCQLEHDALLRLGTHYKSIQGHCQETPAHSENGKRSPSKEHPCNAGLHHRAALSTSSSTRSAEPIALVFVGVLSAAPEPVKAIPEIASAYESSSRVLFVPLTETGPVPLRI